MKVIPADKKQLQNVQGVYISTDKKINGVYIIEPSVFKDQRGYFMESFNQQRLIDNGVIEANQHFIQDNESESSYGVIRGLHMQLPPYSQSKLVRVVNGSVVDVAVDVRPWSETFGKYIAVELSDENKRQLFIPKYFLHGFAVLTEKARFLYKVDDIYNKSSEFGIRYDDPEINIDWKKLTGIPVDKIITSEKDRIANTLNDLKKRLR